MPDGGDPPDGSSPEAPQERRDGPEPVALNRLLKLIFYDDGIERPFASMFDEFGDETDDPALALVVVVKVADDNWSCIVLADMFDESRTVRRH